MTGRQRVIKALNRGIPDIIPKDLGGTTFTAITKLAYENLLDYLGFLHLKDSMRVVSRMTQVVYPHEEVLQLFHIDTRGIVLGKPDSWTDKEIDESSYEDEWHVIRTKPEGSLYYDLKFCPLSGTDKTVQDILNFNYPDPLDDGRFRNLRSDVNFYKQEDLYARILTVGSGPIHMTQYLRGFEDWFTDIGLNEEFFECLMNRVGDNILQMIQKALDVVGSDIDAIAISDDLAHQNGLLFSPSTYRRFIKPIHKKICDLTHQYNTKILFHTCGAVEPFIEDLIEIGVDALNPIQVSAANMDTKMLKERYGKRICFWGGIDTQHIMPHGNIGDVRKEREKRIEDLGKAGGFVLAAVHNLQPDVSPENICALFEA